MKYNTGRYEEQPNGCVCFIPSSLPLDPPLDYTPKIASLLSSADRAIAYMDGTIQMVPDSDLLSCMFARKEALLSAQIEGTIATFSGLLRFEKNLSSPDNPDHLKQVVNNFNALTEGFAKAEIDKISMGFLCSLHKTLLAGVKGKEKMPGFIRPIQNLVGGDDCFTATYVPPPQENVMFCLENLLNYIRMDDDTPPLIKSALIYAYFEMIHPFLDGNGRVGRLLIILYLYFKKVIRFRFFTISYYLKEKREEHYIRLNRISKEGDIEGWIEFYLEGVIKSSNLTSETAVSIKKLNEKLEKWVITNSVGGIHGILLNQLLFSNPIVSIPNVRDNLNISHQAAGRLVNKYVDAGFLVEETGKSRYKEFLFVEYVKILSKGTEFPKVE
ncbi:Fic family protein [Methanospirillum stamsii]|uniref:Cell filamentation protein Fic n=1 Tax=Methanospirillum stamsii TaxID=1277351 RepID=A0A2V2NEW2_9EURY|nr:Fic/DOC family N-terminal domain-containing protein [Methanospirillum stamsii]PWR74927.1 cell filamentation protein Fic [Methanospirillum stamsii]